MNYLDPVTDAAIGGCRSFQGEVTPNTEHNSIVAAMVDGCFDIPESMTFSDA